MDDPAQLSEYGIILLIAIVGILLVSVTIFTAKFISPKNPNPQKLSTYECGEESVGSAWIQFNPRFYVIALVFLLFDVELLFIFPWATVFGRAEFIAADARWGWFTLIEMAIFLGVLILGLVLVWRRGDINWIRPTHQVPKVEVPIPASAYEQLNNQEYAIRDYRAAVEHSATEAVPSPVLTTSRVAFKPKFKKPEA